MLTTDATDPRLGHGSDDQPVPQNEVYLVLSEEERAKGFVRPFRDVYVHVGERPKYPIRDLTPEQNERFGTHYVKYEEYPEGSPEHDEGKVGRFWTSSQLEQKCNGETHMGRALSETYARDPKFYGSTYCSHCSMHRSVAEFVWKGTDEKVGS